MEQPRPTEANDDMQQNLDQVREILFGAQARSFEDRVQRLEARVNEKLGALRHDLSQSLENMVAELRREISDLDERLRTEQRSRGEVVESLASEVHAHQRRMDERVGGFEERMLATHRDARREVEEVTRAIREETQTGIEAAVQSMSGRASEMERRKVERSELALVLTDLAGRLVNEPARSDE